MSDLISRSTAMKNYCNALCPKLQKDEYCNNCIVKAWLNNQPTAYDVDKVVAQLKEMKKENPFISSKKDKSIEASTSRQVLDYAIEIVKRGGNS